MPKVFKRKRIIMLIALLLLGVGLHWSIDRLHGATVNVDLKLKWTAPGDDGIMGVATAYSIRWAETSDSLVNYWDATKELPGAPVPSPALFMDSIMFSVPLETGKDYFFAIKTADEVPNWSQISNIIAINVPDSISPSPINDLQYEVIGVN